MITWFTLDKESCGKEVAFDERVVSGVASCKWVASGEEVEKCEGWCLLRGLHLLRWGVTPPVIRWPHVRRWHQVMVWNLVTVWQTVTGVIWLEGDTRRCPPNVVYLCSRSVQCSPFLLFSRHAHLDPVFQLIQFFPYDRPTLNTKYSVYDKHQTYLNYTVTWLCCLPCVVMVICTSWGRALDWN